jgi:hypothetical protein
LAFGDVYYAALAVGILAWVLALNLRRTKGQGREDAGVPMAA